MADHSRVLEGIPRDTQVAVIPLYMFTSPVVTEIQSMVCITYGSPRDIVTAFFLGVADYLSEPWTPVELVTRTRRFGSSGDEVITTSGATIKLRYQETRLWQLLFVNRGLVVDRATIAGTLELSDDPSSRAVDMAVRRLRRALGPLAAEVETVRGKGYRLRLSAQQFR